MKGLCKREREGEGREGACTFEECRKLLNVGDRCGDGLQLFSILSFTIVVTDSNEQGFLLGGAATGGFTVIARHLGEGE